MNESLRPPGGGAASEGWQELASRDADGLVVRLDWCRPTNAVRIVVDDRRLDQQFELDVDAEDAGAAFRHPFAYAAAHGSSRSALQDALGLSTDLEGATHVC
jgi:hypothetical protein